MTKLSLKKSEGACLRSLIDLTSSDEHLLGALLILEDTVLPWGCHSNAALISGASTHHC